MAKNVELRLMVGKLRFLSSLSAFDLCIIGTNSQFLIITRLRTVCSSPYKATARKNEAPSHQRRGDIVSRAMKMKRALSDDDLLARMDQYDLVAGCERGQDSAAPATNAVAFE
ncbi:hypothetical protein [Paraburkholderia piptadeniae]|uniref:hypothetical protein n=1 Tax=Paraburkholderia piptadeniae TaxID=1701573 RepID=UPI00118048DD|nr:hypothetical protein [Paraburkholderia piptadeniae]